MCAMRRRWGSAESRTRCRPTVSVRQLNLVRASQVVPMPPHQAPCTLPLVYLPLASLVARMTRFELPSRNTCWRSSRYCPMFSGLSQNTGFLIAPWLSPRSTSTDRATSRPARRTHCGTGTRTFEHWAAARWAVVVDPPVRSGETAQHGLRGGGSRLPARRSRS
jgi:hypothetical protein